MNLSPSNKNLLIKLFIAIHLEQNIFQHKDLAPVTFQLSRGFLLFDLFYLFTYLFIYLFNNL